jgi:hypothetical protein
MERARPPHSNLEPGAYYSAIHNELLGDFTRSELIEALENLRFKRRVNHNTKRPMCTVDLDCDVRDALVLALRAQ